MKLDLKIDLEKTDKKLSLDKGGICNICMCSYSDSRPFTSESHMKKFEILKSKDRNSNTLEAVIIAQEELIRIQDSKIRFIEKKYNKLLENTKQYNKLISVQNTRSDDKTIDTLDMDIENRKKDLFQAKHEYKEFKDQTDSAKLKDILSSNSITKVFNIIKKIAKQHLEHKNKNTNNLIEKKTLIKFRLKRLLKRKLRKIAPSSVEIKKHKLIYDDNLNKINSTIIEKIDINKDKDICIKTLKNIIFEKTAKVFRD